MLQSSRTYYLYDQGVDMRKGFHALGGIVVSQMGLELKSGAGFVFLSRRRSHLKLLVWEGDGFSMYYRYLEKGTFEHPKLNGDQSITYEKLLLILYGIESEKIVKRKRFKM